jgi:GTPase
VQNAQIAIQSVDSLVFVVDASVELGGGDRYIADLLTKTQSPIILGLNKVDLQRERAVEESYLALALAQGWTVVRFSALEEDGLPELQQAIYEKLEPGPYYYPPDLVTDQPERFIMGELIREQILRLTRDEVPHSVAVAIERVDEQETLTHVMAVVNVERDSQKGILIGKKGAMMKEIGSAARLQIQKMIAGKVHLELFVRVQPKWRQSRTRLAELGYRVEEE